MWLGWVRCVWGSILRRRNENGEQFPRVTKRPKWPTVEKSPKSTIKSPTFLLRLLRRRRLLLVGSDWPVNELATARDVGPLPTTAPEHF